VEVEPRHPYRIDLTFEDLAAEHLRWVHGDGTGTSASAVHVHRDLSLKAPYSRVQKWNGEIIRCADFEGRTAHAVAQEIASGVLKDADALEEFEFSYAIEEWKVSWRKITDDGEERGTCWVCTDLNCIAVEEDK
jgi:hypothetical protein